MLLARPLAGIAVVLGVFAPIMISSRRAAPPLSTTAVNQLHSDALTTLKVTTAAPVQDTRAIVIQRGTGIDGRLRSGSAQHMAIGANPFESVWRAPTVGGIDLVTGNYPAQEVDKITMHDLPSCYVEPRQKLSRLSLMKKCKYKIVDPA